MARQYYGINRGQNEFDIGANGQSGTSSPGDDLEVNYDLTKSWTKEELLLGLEKISNQILKDIFPPN